MADSVELPGSVVAEPVEILGPDRAAQAPEPKLYFNDLELEKQKTLAEYGISFMDEELFFRVNTIETPYVIRERKRIIITDQPLAIWEKEHDEVLLSLLVEQISNGGRNNILYPGMDSWRNIVANFNESTGHKYEYKHLLERFKFYEREYQIVNRIRHHPKFSWDHQGQVVIATDAEWINYIKRNHDARPYRRRAIPYIDMLEVVFAGKKEPKIMVSNE